MYKKANSPPPYWQSILTKIKNLGLRPEIMAMLNNFNQIVWDAAPPADNPNAIAYVSSEDKNNDGKIDKIHFVLNKFPPNANEDQMDGIVEMVAKTLVHEYGHIEDFNPETNDFPGGEGAAEQAERAFEPLLKQKLNLTTNSSYKLCNKHKISGEIKMLKELVKLANHLDSIGHGEISNDLDAVIKKLAESPSEEGRQRYLEQATTPTTRDFMIERKEQSVVAQAEEMRSRILEGFYGGAVTSYAKAPSIHQHTRLNKWVSTSVSDIRQAKSFLRDFEASIDILKKMESAGQMRAFDSFHPDRMEYAADSLSSRLGEHVALVSSPINKPAEPSLPEDERGPAKLTMHDTDSREEAPKKSKTVSKIQDVLGIGETGVWKDVVRSGRLRGFLEDNADNISYDGDEYLEDSEKVVNILNSGVKGFGVRGGSTARDNTYRSWLKFIEELLSIDTRVTESLETLKNASHGGEDNVEERLDAMAKQLDKMFKY